MSEQNRQVVIGIDGGGTHTRVMIADRSGEVLAYTEAGSSSLHKDRQARDHVQAAILQAVAMAGITLGEVRMLTAGIAGYDRPSDDEWVRALTDIEGLRCPQEHVNDTVVAHSGALLTEPGIIVIAGTGSNIYARAESGEAWTNGMFRHYAASAARFLAYDAVHEWLAGQGTEADRALGQRMQEFWGCATRQALAVLASQGFMEDRRDRDRLFAELAPVITDAASAGSPLARAVCDRAVHQMTVGIEMLGLHFQQQQVKVALIGSVINSDYVNAALRARLREGRNKDYEVVAPALPPVVGAVLQALRRLEIPIEQPLLQRLAMQQQMN